VWDGGDVQRKSCDDHNNLGESSGARKLRNGRGKNLISSSRMAMMMSECAAKSAILQLIVVLQSPFLTLPQPFHLKMRRKKRTFVVLNVPI
jgi:hypothetical protein